MSWCLPHLLQKQAQRTPDAVVFVSPGRAPLTYGRLWQHTVETVQTLSVLGVSPHDRIALVLPNGPEMAVAFLAVATSMTCVPLNPAYSAPEYDRYLADVGVKVLIVQAGMDSPARDVASAHGLPIIELSPLHEAEAGLFALQGETQAHTRVHAWAQPDDVALLLLTSGTMSRPKIVRLTQNNICTAADNMHAFLRMTAGDRCLNVVPFFHIYGLVGMILTSLMAGASVVCTPGFDAAPFFAWMEAFRPTWYAGVPAMHHALLSYVAQHRETVVPCRLRFIRSGGALLSPQVLAELENLFQAPVLVSYGMTEASAQITCNPLPPRPRKLGSVGVAAGPKVAIMDAMGSILPVGTMGEIVIRGASVTPGYDNDLTTTRQAFTHGWFRTGDQGYLDADGYLFITGRTQEFINRGGEKIAPQEVDDVLMKHPAIAQAVTFAMPHARLGEEVAAAVVLHPHARATDHDIRRFAATHLATFKVPQRIVIVDDLPKGPTGKLQRVIWRSNSV